ncbi:MAG: hypothetical protein L0211_02710 [Planctomycetaceae bacterium]|nr:hypothetical protein [Planctomycetaceae bacterium]
MTIEGTFVNGVVVFDQPPPLPDGTRVEVVVRPVDQSPSPEKREPTMRGLLKLAGKATDLPPDMAVQHDHYIHGASRR